MTFRTATRAVTFALPGALGTPTGGYRYDARVIDGLLQLGWTVEVLLLGSGFPHPTAEARRRAGDKLTQCLGLVIVDGLALGVLPDAAEALHDRLIALVHHPLALETGLSSREAARLAASERAALSHAAHVVCTSSATARLLMSDFGCPPGRVSVARPGTERVETRRWKHTPMSLLSVGAVSRRKGYDCLIEALAALRDLEWRLSIVGDLTRDPATVAALRARVAALGLEGQVAFRGAVPDAALATAYRTSDIFVLASRHEGYGMAYAEALAHGLPVIATSTAADLIPPEAGLIVATDDVAALAKALRLLIEDGALRSRLSKGALMAAKSLPGWAEAVGVFDTVLKRLSADLESRNRSSSIRL